jgi:hypothetical protein
VVCNAKPAEYYSSAGVHLGDLWDILGQILDKAEAGAKQVAKLTGKPYDLAVHKLPRPKTAGRRLLTSFFFFSFVLLQRTDRGAPVQPDANGRRQGRGGNLHHLVRFVLFTNSFLPSFLRSSDCPSISSA